MSRSGREQQHEGFDRGRILEWLESVDVYHQPSSQLDEVDEESNFDSEEPPPVTTRPTPPTQQQQQQQQTSVSSDVVPDSKPKAKAEGRTGRKRSSAKRSRGVTAMSSIDSGKGEDLSSSCESSVFDSQENEIHSCKRHQSPAHLIESRGQRSRHSSCSSIDEFHDALRYTYIHVHVYTCGGPLSTCTCALTESTVWFMRQCTNDCTYTCMYM
jgi:hypothetical protein